MIQIDDSVNAEREKAFMTDSWGTKRSDEETDPGYHGTRWARGRAGELSGRDGLEDRPRVCCGEESRSRERSRSPRVLDAPALTPGPGSSPGAAREPMRPAMLVALLKGVFALLALLIGSSLIVWILYNELVERQPQYVRPPLAGVFGIAPVMLIFGWCWGREALAALRRR